ncbi:MAG: type II toxin-antitoxin system RelE/ParE family toxin [Treponema sp.]|nr:type II toxin-antitoxin system RelE/ParE family toxin [Treponema sp.]
MSDDELKDIAGILEAGQADVDLGGGVYKQRVARLNEGRSGGYRVIVFFKSGMRTFFVYGFAKSDQDNISGKELQKDKKMAQSLFLLTDKQLDALVAMGEYNEI